MNFSEISRIPHFTNYKLEHLSQTGSTNDNVKELIKQDSACNILQTTDFQTQGRGQYSRKWESKPNQCLMFSFTDTFSLEAFPPSLTAGISLASALEKLAKKELPNLWLKWPNDLWYGENKLAGILVESVFLSNKLKCIIGIGINILPLNGSLNAACVNDFIKDVNANDVLNEFCLEWSKNIYLDSQKQFELWNHYAKKSFTQKFKILINNEERFIGIPKGITPKGELLIQDENGNIRTLNAASLIPVNK